MTKLTANEILVLKAIDESEFGTGSLTDAIWTFSVSDHCELPRRSLPGIISSLSQKGFLLCNNCGKDSTVRMTDAGALAYVHANGGAKPHDIKLPEAAAPVVAPVAKVRRTRKAKRGGKRAGAGRKPSIAKMSGERFNVTLPTEVAQVLREIGCGSLSQGIMIALAARRQAL